MVVAGWPLTRPPVAVHGGVRRPGAHHDATRFPHRCLGARHPTCVLHRRLYPTRNAFYPPNLSWSPGGKSGCLLLAAIEAALLRMVPSSLTAARPIQWRTDGVAEAAPRRRPFPKTAMQNPHFHSTSGAMAHCPPVPRRSREGHSDRPPETAPAKGEPVANRPSSWRSDAQPACERFSCPKAISTTSCLLEGREPLTDGEQVALVHRDPVGSRLREPKHAGSAILARADSGTGHLDRSRQPSCRDPTSGTLILDHGLLPASS